MKFFGGEFDDVRVITNISVLVGAVNEICAGKDRGYAERVADGRYQQNAGDQHEVPGG